jgi:hypothetical protein
MPEYSFLLLFKRLFIFEVESFWKTKRKDFKAFEWAMFIRRIAFSLKSPPLGRNRPAAADVPQSRFLKYDNSVWDP